MGHPGGVFHLRDGAVIAVDSPGSPGVETLLLRSGRISEADWHAALCDGASTRSHAEALVASGTIDPGELRALVVAATQDGALAIAAGDIEDCAASEEPGGSADVLVPLTDGVVVAELLADTESRLAELAALPVLLSPYRDRVVAADDTQPSAAADDRQSSAAADSRQSSVDGPQPSVVAAQRRAIMDHANGRRTARDIAFAVGRGVHPITVEISRMLDEGLLEIAPTTVAIIPSRWGFTSLGQRSRPEPAADSDDPDQANPLPVRRPKRAEPDDQDARRPTT